MILVYRYRVKSLNGRLNEMARSVNVVWNYCESAQRHAVKWGQKWPSGFDLCALTAGSFNELALPAMSVNSVCVHYAQGLRHAKRFRLRYRGKRSLGWVPLRGQSVKWLGDRIRFAKQEYRLFASRPLPEGAKIKDGSSFAQDARGNWFLNLAVDVPDVPLRGQERAVGIDLGLKDLATLSTGETIPNPRHLQKLADKLAKAQRAGKKRLARNIHARIASARRDHLHKLSTRITREFDYIAVGNVRSAPLARTSMAKSVLDAGWSTFRGMLRYKSIATGAVYEEVCERLTSQTCSSCGALPPERPRGIAGLGIRRWSCSECGADHDRDTNAALNILVRSGHRAPVVGAVAA